MQGGVEYRSTTSLLRMALDLSGGNIDEAMQHLRHLGKEYINAYSAIRVLKMKIDRKPGAQTFSMLPNGFVTVA